MSGHDLEDPLKLLERTLNLAVALKELNLIEDTRQRGLTGGNTRQWPNEVVSRIYVLKRSGAVIVRAIAHPPNRFKQQISRNGGQLNHSLSFENGRVRKDKKTEGKLGTYAFDVLARTGINLNILAFIYKSGTLTTAPVSSVAGLVAP